MIITILILLLTSNALTLSREISLYYSRLVILGLSSVVYLTYNSLYISSLEKGIGIYGALFNVTLTTNLLTILICFIIIVILGLRENYPREVYTKILSDLHINMNLKFRSNITRISNKMGTAFSTIEFHVILVLTGIYPSIDFPTITPILRDYYLKDIYNKKVALIAVLKSIYFKIIALKAVKKTIHSISFVIIYYALLYLIKLSIITCNIYIIILTFVLLCITSIIIYPRFKLLFFYHIENVENRKHLNKPNIWDSIQKTFTIDKMITIPFIIWLTWYSEIYIIRDITLLCNISKLCCLGFKLAFIVLIHIIMFAMISRVITWDLVIQFIVLRLIFTMFGLVFFLFFDCDISLLILGLCYTNEPLYMFGEGGSSSGNNNPPLSNNSGPGNPGPNNSGENLLALGNSGNNHDQSSNNTGNNNDQPYNNNEVNQKNRAKDIRSVFYSLVEATRVRDERDIADFEPIKDKAKKLSRATSSSCTYHKRNVGPEAMRELDRLSSVSRSTTNSKDPIGITLDVKITKRALELLESNKQRCQAILKDDNITPGTNTHTTIGKKLAENQMLLTEVWNYKNKVISRMEATEINNIKRKYPLDALGKRPELDGYFSDPNNYPKQSWASEIRSQGKRGFDQYRESFNDESSSKKKRS